MAKNQMPFPVMNGGGTGKKVLGLLFLAALVVLVLKNPTDAAQWFKTAWATATAAVEQVATFLQAVIG
ncbi:hypothetical protein SAMN05421805_10161 [Saccharopolyspora antimicrobica]|uniref:Uncharacterized protein n=1 Tax=Saccharopolyspora antimicrobica TaxID=455193 RepID=A0A1I4QCW4_9PSEU|nr:hypothetical protein [Saccharopolyspora antimicrobica]RKT84869.1 hypothetical protein ATL45_3200 [Saccharopolyspora antimicrobica]SFM37636.1 hypothetical protein SAMN05421805_10161 [Saccharopolyspora antimicrobica]